MESWIDLHPWMTFILGITSLLTLNTFFVSMGGGYRKFPPPIDKNSKESKVLSD